MLYLRNNRGNISPNGAKFGLAYLVFSVDYSLWIIKHDGAKILIKHTKVLDYSNF